MTNIGAKNIRAMSIGPMNMVALVGRLARPAENRVLPSGDRMVAYEITVERPGARAEGVSVVWFAAPARAGDHDVGEVVVVVGRVRRRFYQAAGATRSRTEVVADVVVPTRHAKRARAAIEGARAQLASCLL